MKKIKGETTLLTRRMGEGDWADAVELCSDIEKSFAALNLASDKIPEEYFELQQMFNVNLAKIKQTCLEKDFDTADIRLRALKQSCSYCHRILRKELDRMNMDTDFDVAVDKLYKDVRPKTMK
jgi:Na+/phosphate symporter